MFKDCGTKFGELWDVVSGDIGSFVRDEDFTNEPIVLSIDTIVVDLTKEDEEDAQWGAICDIYWLH